MIDNDNKINEVKALAAIDIGTNSFHLLIADVAANGEITLLAHVREMHRLNTVTSRDNNSKITSEIMQTSLKILEGFMETSFGYGVNAVKAVATSAIRKASNRTEFIELIRKKIGLEIEIISGEEEARLMYTGVFNYISKNKIYLCKNKIMAVDIGGGSTEIIIGAGGDVFFSGSEELGAVGLTRDFFSDGIDSTKVRICREYIKEKLYSIVEKTHEIGFSELVGTAGTFETIVRVSLLMENKIIPDFSKSKVLSIPKSSMLKSIGNIIMALTPEKISKISGIEKQRADIILAGSLILEYLLNNCELKKNIFSPYSLREGIIYDMISKYKTKHDN